MAESSIDTPDTTESTESTALESSQSSYSSPALEQRLDLPSLIPLFTGQLEKLGGPSKKVWQMRYFALFGSYSSVILYWKSPPSQAVLAQNALAIPSSPPRGRIMFTRSALVSSQPASEFLDTQHGKHTFSFQIRTNGTTYFFRAASEEIRFHWRAALELAVTEAPEGTEKEPWRLESACNLCRKPFSFTRRKQYCRLDFHAYCENCMNLAAKKKVQLEPFGGNVRICNQCAGRIDWQAEDEKRKAESRGSLSGNGFSWGGSGRGSPTESPSNSLPDSSMVPRGSATGIITESEAGSEWSDAEVAVQKPVRPEPSHAESRSAPRKIVKKSKRAAKKGAIRTAAIDEIEEEDDADEDFDGNTAMGEEDGEDAGQNGQSFPRAETNWFGETDSGRNSPLSSSAPQGSNVPVVKSSYSRLIAKPAHKAEPNSNQSQPVPPKSPGMRGKSGSTETPGHRRKKSRANSTRSGRSRSRSRRRSKSMQRDDDDDDETPGGPNANDRTVNGSGSQGQSLSRSTSYAPDAESGDSINMRLMASRSPPTMIVNDNYVIMQDDEDKSGCCSGCSIS